MPRSCFFVGSGTIALRCLEILIKTHHILGVFSSDRSLQAWAEAQSIAHPLTRSEFEALLLARDFDYLFSVNNGWIVPELVLKRAKCAVINYHSSPLPKYAGVHATTWAIQGETEHAVTWHEVVGAIDAGRILKQVKFPIFPDDTALSVNTRCDETAIAAFAELVDELAERVTPLPQWMSACCDQPQPSLKILPPNDQQMLVEWNATAKRYPQCCLHDLIAAQAARTPDAIAVECGEIQLSYRELDRRSNQLARWLVKLGVVPETIVALCLPRSVEMLIGMIGILKAGGAYVPIDPSYPLDRIAYLLTDSRPQAIVTTAALRDRFFPTAESVICLDEQAALLAWFEADPLPTQVTPSNLAYVIYTSGSTGKPKGVEIEHRSLVNHCWAIADLYDLSADDRMLQSASSSFDIAGEQIYPTLLRGGTLILRPDDLMESFDRFTRFIDRHQITAMVLPTAFWHEWVAELLATDRLIPDSLRILGVGTEKVLAHRLDQWQQLSGGRVTFLQGYGPTEATITCTIYRHDDRPRAVIPIGRPLPNTEIYILDAHLQPVPIGMTGELYIGGDCLARGYHRQSELSDRLFILHPFRAGDRLYKTGDTARFEPNGEIVFCGRTDHQIKLNGFRIELGEIEAVLNAEPSVKQAIVHPSDVNGKRILAAYVVLHSPIPVVQLQEKLKQTLPPYMIPAAIVLMDKLPLLPSGKIDRSALPTPPRLQTAPRDDIEQQLVQLWQQLLDVEVGIDDNFFAIGGSSLTAVRLTDRIQTQFCRDLPLATIFQQPTIAQLANVLRQTDAPVFANSIVALRSSGSRPPLFLFQGVDLYRSLVAHLDADQPVYSLAFEINHQHFETVEALAAHYIKELRTIQPQGPYHLGGASFGGMVALEVAQQLQAQGESIALLALFDTPAPHAFEPKPRRQRLYGHVSNLLRFGWRYVAKKMQAKLHRAAFLFAQPDGQASSPYEFVREIYEQLMAIYQPQPYAGQITLFLATDRRAIADSVCDPALVEIDPLFGWGKLAQVEVYDLAGDHLGILKEPHVAQLACQLQHCLHKATQLDRAARQPAIAQFG